MKRQKTLSKKGCDKAKTLSKKGYEKATTLSKKGCEKAKTLPQKGCEKAKTSSKKLFSTPQISESIPFLFSYAMFPLAAGAALELKYDIYGI